MSLRSRRYDYNCHCTNTRKRYSPQSTHTMSLRDFKVQSDLLRGHRTSSYELAVPVARNSNTESAFWTVGRFRFRQQIKTVKCDTSKPPRLTAEP
eukprot:6210167-Pleurochrysis_carterae.AAC.3